MRVTAGKSTTMLIMLGVLIGAFACAPRVAPPPNAVRRIAVLPPGGPLGGRGTSVTTYGVTVESLGDVLASAARDEIARRGFQVLDPGLVETASGGRVRASPEMAAEIIASAQLDATALFIRVRRWEFAYPTLRTNEVIASLDAVARGSDHVEGRVGDPTARSNRSSSTASSLGVRRTWSPLRS